jgi:hypothetical protein
MTLDRWELLRVLGAAAGDPGADRAARTARVLRAGYPAIAGVTVAG